MATEIKDCPFCGSSDVSHGEVTTNLGARLVTQSECQQCGALGPYVDIRNVGIGKEDKLSEDAWNRRPALAASGGNAAPNELHSAAMRAVEAWVSAEYTSTKRMCAGAPAHEKALNKAEIAARKAIDNLAAPNAALVAALGELIDVAERCDSWESFPSNALDNARAALSAAGVKGD